MKRIDTRQLFRWGKGGVFTVLVFLFVSLLLAANTAALVLSIPEIVREVPKEHRSRLSGTLELPYIISGSDEISVSMPDTVNITDPFPVTAVFPGGRIPATDPYIEFSNGDESFRYRMGTFEDGDVNVSSVYIPGIPHAGSWSYRLVQYENGPASSKIGSYSPPNGMISVMDPGGIRYHLDLDPDLGVGSVLFLKIVGNSSGPYWKTIISPFWNVEASIDHSTVEMICNSVDMMIDVSGLPSGWHRLDLIYGDNINSTLNESFTYLFYRNGDAGYQTPMVKAMRVFNGFDEAFGQDPEGNVNFRWGTGELYSGDIYRIEAEYLQDPRGDTKVMGEVLASYIPNPGLIVWINDNEYPMIFDPREGIYHGYITTPTEIDGDLDLTIKPTVWAGISKERSIDVDLRKDRTPDISLEPDPWEIGNIGDPGGFYINISAGPFQLGYRDIEDQPDLMITGKKYNMSVDREEFWPVWSSRVNPAGEDQADIHVDVEASYVYYEFPVIVFPWPPFVFGIPLPMMGWFAVVWFFLMFSAILSSVGALIYTSTYSDRTVGSKKRRIVSPIRFESDFSITFRVYIAIIFFSLAVVLLFNLMDQSTPTPEFLSGAVPIWARMMGLAGASVWEEVIVRFLMIGVPLFLIKTLSNKESGSFSEDLSKKRIPFKELIGGRNVFGRSEVTLIILSSSLFGLAHLGWGPWKVVPTFVSGLLFGYLFIRVGLHASIVVHFLIDYSGFLGEITGSGFWIVYIVYYVSLLIGGLFLAMIIVEAAGWIAERFGRKSVPGWIYLVVHSLAATAFGFAFIFRGDLILSVIFLQVPFISLLAYFLDRIGIKFVSRFMIFSISLMTIALAPLGMAWIIDSVRSDREKIGT